MVDTQIVLDQNDGLGVSEVDVGQALSRRERNPRRSLAGSRGPFCHGARYYDYVGRGVLPRGIRVRSLSDEQDLLGIHRFAILKELGKDVQIRALGSRIQNRLLR